MDGLKNETPEVVQNQTEQELEACRTELTKAKERGMYLQAEFDNYKKRLEKERSSWMEAAQDVVLIDLLTIVDDMERALQELQTVPQELSVHLTGFQMIAKSLAKILKKYDIEEIPYSKEFNPEFFEAVMQVASPSFAPGEVVAILQKGYTRASRVLRPAKVSVAQ